MRHGYYIAATGRCHGDDEFASTAMAKRIIFLDFDGVLNSHAFFKKNRGKGKGPLGPAGALDPDAVAKLNRIIDQTGADVVVSSSWRHGRSVSELWQILGKRGFTGTVIDKTADWGTEMDGNVICAEERGNEIRAWLDKQTDIESFVVLDDNADMSAVRDRFIQTDPDIGLTDEIVERVIEILKGAD